MLRRLGLHLVHEGRRIGVRGREEVSRVCVHILRELEVNVQCLWEAMKLKFLPSLAAEDEALPGRNVFALFEK